jgi:hypothetical protein
LTRGRIGSGYDATIAMAMGSETEAEHDDETSHDTDEKPG